MRSIKITQIDENINKYRANINHKLRKERYEKPRIRRNRTRSPDEQYALTKIAKASVEKAKHEGKMKMIGRRTMYYDPTD